MKKQTTALILFTCFLYLTGCGGKNSESMNNAQATPPATEAPAAAAPDNNQPDTGIPDEKDDGAITRADEDGLVAINIENGAAELFFDVEQWEELYSLSSVRYTPDDSPFQIWEGTFPVVASGKVRDACIGKIDGLDIGYSYFVTPTLILLMEDGSLEFLLIDPFVTEDWSYYSKGKLPWVKDIVSLTYENSSEGMGGMTIFATDEDGLRYDVLLLCNLSHVFEEYWSFDQEREDGNTLFCNLHLTENFEVFFDRGILDDMGINDYSEYSGSYSVTIAENDPSDLRPGLISFDLKLGYSDNPADNNIRTTYFISATDMVSLGLWHSDGGHLLFDDHGPITELRFNAHSEADDYDDWYSSDWFDHETVIVTDWDEADHTELFNDDKFSWFGADGLNNEGLINYLLVKLPEAREKMQKLGMAALCTGETSDLIEAGLCRNVWLGANYPGEFAREILYAIASYGDIYEYHPDEDRYYLVYSQ